MTIDEINCGSFYLIKVGSKVAPVFIQEANPIFVVGINRNTGREISVVAKDVPRRVLRHIPNILAWEQEQNG